jgi:hypothetical protein
MKNRPHKIDQEPQPNGDPSRKLEPALNRNKPSRRLQPARIRASLSAQLAVMLFLSMCIAVVLSCRPSVERRASQTANAPNDHGMVTSSNGHAESLHLPPRATARYTSQEEANRLSAGCFTCHSKTDSPSMHESPAVFISCIDCHGGDPTVYRPETISNERPYSDEYLELMFRAHPKPRFPDAWSDPQTGAYTSANPEQSYTLLNYEDPAFIQFINPGDLRVAHRTCGECHADIVDRVRNSMMTHGAQLWGAALYNNGSYPFKLPRFGESYSMNGVPQRLVNKPPPGLTERARGVLDYLDPLPRWEITQMGNILRAFERGGRIPRQELEVGLPNPFEEPGRPDMKLSDRGLGTQLATDPVFLGLQKTRLLDPLLSFLGTNDHPGDYRSSGCTACHVVYANDRFAAHSAHYAAAGLLGQSQTVDPTIDRDERGHPIRHVFTSAIPSSQCVVCHIHPGTSFANSYLGYTWWDNETHGDYMYPREQRYPTAEQVVQSLMTNPESAAVRGLWSNLWPDAEDHHGRPAGENFLERVSELNPELDKTQFADFHGHGWIFRAVFKQDREGRLLDAYGKAVDSVTPAKLQQAITFRAESRDTPLPTDVPVHLKDIHLERGMHCMDCHFEQDVHGDGNLYGEVRNAIEIDCVDCHGTVTARSTLVSSGPNGGNDLSRLHTPYGKRRFDFRAGQLFQRSSLDPDLEWEVPQLVDTVDPDSPRYNAKAAYAKTVQRGTQAWGDPTCPESKLAHGNSSMACYTCHTSWMTSCFGCHLPMQANMRMPMLHNEGEVLRNFVTYNFQVLRDDVFMLGRDSTIKGNRIVPVRSSSAVIVGSQNANREWIYSQQQTVSSEGYSGQAFNPHFPHAVRTSETKTCTDCHVSDRNDNNAWMAQLLLHGTNYVNFLGRFVYVAQGREGFEAIVVTERTEPQAVIGSYLHGLAYPDDYRKHLDNHRELKESYEHQLVDGIFPARGEILDLQVRGEYLYTARGRGGFYAYDIANIDNKGFSERIITSPVSPLGQSLHVRTKYATSVASPSTLAVDPTRRRLSSDPHAAPATMLDPWAPHHVNQEQAMHPVYAFLYVADLYEGLVIIGDRTQGVGTLLDGDPTNNFLKRARAFNPDGILDGAVHVTLAGHHAYISCQRGLVIVDLDNPLDPQIAGVIGSPHLINPRAAAIQFRYVFVTDEQGLKVIDITDPHRPRPLEESVVPIEDARRLYVARTYAYVAAGRDGLVIVDVKNPEAPRVDQVFTADGAINDARDVKVGMTNASAFAYLADGHNGLRVIQLTSPAHTPGNAGFSPRPTPNLIATYHTHGPALAISKGLDRDRAVDESGHQVAVFGRIGARPMTLEEQQRLYLRDGKLYTVSDEVPERDSGANIKLSKSQKVETSKSEPRP